MTLSNTLLTTRPAAQGSCITNSITSAATSFAASRNLALSMLHAARLAAAACTHKRADAPAWPSRLARNASHIINVHSVLCPTTEKVAART